MPQHDESRERLAGSLRQSWSLVHNYECETAQALPDLLSWSRSLPPTTSPQEIPEALWALRLGLRVVAEKAKGPPPAASSAASSAAPPPQPTQASTEAVTPGDGSSSDFWPYVASLPTAISVPMFFSPDDVKALQYPPLVQQVRSGRVMMPYFARLLCWIFEANDENRLPRLCPKLQVSLRGRFLYSFAQKHLASEPPANGGASLFHGIYPSLSQSVPGIG